MSKYAFPSDLLDKIKSRWQSPADEQFLLPEDGLLRQLLETCYHASLRTSEQRPVQCVVAYVPQAQIQEGAMRLANHPLDLTDSELVRLSPVTEYRQTLIGCDQKDGELRIWGFFEFGHAWVQHSAGDPPGVPVQPEDLPPNCLTITIKGPGALTVSQGRTGLVRLRDGRIILPQDNPFQTRQNPLGKFFDELISDLPSSVPASSRINSCDEQGERRSLLNVYTTCILALLERIRLKQHGGSLVLLRVPFDEHLAHITFTVAEHAGLARDIIAYQALDDSLRAPRPASDHPGQLERCRLELAIHRVSRQLIRGLNQISLLAAVDGAVLLDDHLRVKGFGVRFPLLLPPGTVVVDAVSGSEYRCDQWGLRHQSVFSICHKCEEAVGLIVSQDGEAKAVKAVEGQLFFWDGILD